MKKTFVVSLILVSIFLIGSSEIASTKECKTYLCTGKYLCIGGESGTWSEECVSICIDEGFALAGGEWWGCDLGGRSLFSNNKNFVGVGYSTEGYLGCSIILRGRSVTIDLYEDEANPPCMDQLRCVESICAG
jgi:hypothetical protein